MLVDYEKIKKEQIRKNTQQLRDNITDKGLRKKIKNWADKYDLSFEFVKHKVFTDDIFALYFVKDPGRQNFHENTAAEALKSFAILYDFKLLPKGGLNAKVVNSGMLVSLEESKQSTSNPKTIDFEWKIKTNTGKIIFCYASHKYTKDNGGSQDNQYKDLKNFMENARQNKSDNKMFFAICDGQYYQTKNKTTGRTKIEELNMDYARENKLIAITIQNIYEYLEDIINNN